MEAKPWSFLSVLEPKSCYEVPLYQRQYVWDQADQWEPLWEDISRKFEESLNNVNNAPPHFLGAIVVDQEQTKMGELKRHLIIDGQQRLITFQVFLAAFRDFSKFNNFEELANELDEFIFNRGMMSDPEKEKYKVWPTDRDKELFNDVITTRSLDELKKKYPLIRRKYQRQPDPRPLLVDCYIFFYDKISEFFNASIEDSPYNKAPLKSRVETAFHTLSSALQVVVIELSNLDDPQVIFETLNARGYPLLPSDLLRNFIFLRARHEGLKTQEVYKDYWEEFDEDFWRQEISQGRTTRPISDLFMQHFLTAQTARDISVKHLYIEYKNWATKENPFPTVQKELEAIADYRTAYRRLIEPQTQDPISHIAKFLRIFDMSTAYPPLLNILNAKLKEENLIKIGIVLESYLVRRTIIGLSTKNLNRIFLGLASHVKSKGANFENVVEYLSSRGGESGEWPNDERFLQGWMNSPIYSSIEPKKIVHLFMHLNSYYKTDKNEAIELTTIPTVEHIMPVSWEDNWPLPDGSKGMKWFELQEAKEDDERAIATRYRQQKINTIGNLTLVSQSLNSSMSNAPWSEKRKALKESSLLPLNLKLTNLQNWNESEIEARGKELFNFAREIWPSPPVQ